MSGRTTLKTYFLTGSSPSEANFADLIDSVLVLSEDLTDSLSTTSSVIALTASAGKSLSDSLTALATRVVTLEGADTSFASNYYNKSEVDSSISTVSSLFNTLPYAGQITAIDTRVTSIESTITGLAPISHNHLVSNIEGLEDALNLKATISYVQGVEAGLVATINALEVGDESAEVAELQSQVDTINTTISGLPTSSDISSKADVSHSHTTSNISDLNTKYYNKTQTDGLLSNIEPKVHTHNESEIIDLDKYTTGAIDLKLTDHNARTDNPHGTTKAQIGLGDVENLSVIDLFQTPEAKAYATDEELNSLISTVSLNATTVSIHSALTNNPHGVTKAQVSLGNVPNVNFQALLDTHLADANPHNIDLSFFDVYAKAGTDTRIQFYLDSFRYPYRPSSIADSSGAIGDLVYDDSGLFFKFGSTEWRQVLSSKTFSDGKTVIETPRFEVTSLDGVNLFSIDNATNTTNINTAIVSIGGATNISNILNVTGDVSLGGSLNVSNLFKVDSNTTTINTSIVSIGGATHIDNTLDVTGSVSLGSTLNVGGQVSLSSGLSVGENVSIAGTLSVAGHTNISSLRATTIVGSSLDAGSGEIKTTGAVNSGSLNAGSGLIQTTGNIKGKDLTLTGDLTVNGTTTSLDTTNLLIEDNIVVLNKNQTGTPESTLKSGFEIERGDSTNSKLFWDENDDTWKLDIAGTVKTIAFNEDLTAHTSDTGNPHSVTKAQVGLGIVENTKLSTWAGSGKITTLGTISTGTVPSTNTSGFHTVATSGSYDDLSNQPTTAELLADLKVSAIVPTGTASYTASSSTINLPRGNKITSVSGTTVTGDGSATATADANGDISISFELTKGDKGDQGIQGIQGIKGDTGSTGSTGPQGGRGLTGATGASGTNGTNGTNGANGANGTTPTFTYDEGTKTLAIKNA